MNIFDITQYSEGIPPEDVRAEIAKNSGRIVIEYPMTFIHSSNSHLDIIHNYLEASYVAESLGRYAASITTEEISRFPACPICRYNIVVAAPEPFIEKLTQLSLALYEDQEDDGVVLDYATELDDYADSLDERQFLCPDLVDGYYANLVGAADCELDSECEGYLATEYKKHPEREYGFWKSAYSNTIGACFYVSRECWVVPVGIDICKLLSVYSGLSSAETYEEATLFSVDHISYLVHKHAVVYFPFGPLLHAKNFVGEVLSSDTDEGVSASLLTYSPTVDEVEELRGINLRATTTPPKYLLSRSGFSIIVEDGQYRYIFFPEQIEGNRKTALYEAVSAIFTCVAECAGVTRSVDLSWDGFDDEKFESLCYDIIYHDPRFDNQTIRKMGKSRSRDGGRDIVVYTRGRLGSPKKMYIFQCKFTQVNSSLTAHKVQNISDTIVQYNAHGYGVMTPVVIDSGLYDRIDDICDRYKVENTNWSVLEIERFIARHPNLKERYFTQ